MLNPRIKAITNKRLQQLKRNSGDPAYQKWRRLVLEKDGHRCQFGNCPRTENLEIHHIKRFTDSPHLKLEVYNGLTLCKEHHKSIQSKERYFEMGFLMKSLDNLKRHNNKNG